jgi:hypothetical protein
VIPVLFILIVFEARVVDFSEWTPEDPRWFLYYAASVMVGLALLAIIGEAAALRVLSERRVLDGADFLTVTSMGRLHPHCSLFRFSKLGCACLPPSGTSEPLGRFDWHCSECWRWQPWWLRSCASASPSRLSCSDSSRLALSAALPAGDQTLPMLGHVSAVERILRPGPALSFGGRTGDQ